MPQRNALAVHEPTYGHGRLPGEQLDVVQPGAASFAKLRFSRIAEFLGAAFTLALVGVATSYVIGA